MQKTIETLYNKSINDFDLTNPEKQNSLYQLTDALLALGNAQTVSEEIYKRSKKSDCPLEFRIAFKLFDSRIKITSIKRPLKINILFALWGEQNRLKPRSESNPNGEDSLNIKINQLEWITRDTPIDWQLIAIDDGCPHSSGNIAQDILKNHRAKDKVQVLFLKDHIPSDHSALANLKSVDDSRKGGAIILGALHALEKNKVDAIIYTDADNSVHLGQIGLLLSQYTQKTPVVLGNRKDPDSVLVKQEARWGIGIKLLRHMQRMVGYAIFSQGILDTQAAFKLYDKDILRKILIKPSVYDFSFDSDWILACIAEGIKLVKIPFAFVDSFAESASIVQGPMTTWETLLMGLVKSLQMRGIDHNFEMARILEEEINSSADLDALINKLPIELENAKDIDLGDPKIFSPEQIQKWIQKCKSAQL